MKKIFVFLLASIFLTIVANNKALSQPQGLHPSDRGRADIQSSNLPTVVSATDSPTIVYEGRTGEGLWKSTNGGKNFFPINQGLGNPYPITLAISPHDDRLIYAGCLQYDSFPTLYRSTDAGLHWLFVAPFHALPLTVTQVFFDEANSEETQVTARDAQGNVQVWRSRNGGLLWTRAVVRPDNNAVQEGK